MSQIYVPSSGGSNIPGDVPTSFITNVGTAVPVANTITLITANSTVKFVATGSTITENFGLSNLILGTSALSITTATLSVGLGFNALNSLTTGPGNTAIGYNSMLSTTTAFSNSSLGQNSLLNNISSPSNVAFGISTLQVLSSGTGNNMALGSNSLGAIVTGSNNIAVGGNSGLSLTGSDSSNIIIGNPGTPGDNNTIRMGFQGIGAGQHNRCFIAGIIGVTPANSQSVVINSSTGQLGVNTDSNMIVAKSIPIDMKVIDQCKMSQ